MSTIQLLLLCACFFFTPISVSGAALETVYTTSVPAGATVAVNTANDGIDNIISVTCTSIGSFPFPATPYTASAYVQKWPGITTLETLPRTGYYYLEYDEWYVHATGGLGLGVVAAASTQISMDGFAVLGTFLKDSISDLQPATHNVVASQSGWNHRRHSFYGTAGTTMTLGWACAGTSGLAYQQAAFKNIVITAATLESTYEIIVPYYIPLSLKPSININFGNFQGSYMMNFTELQWIDHFTSTPQNTSYVVQEQVLVNGTFVLRNVTKFNTTPIITNNPTLEEVIIPKIVPLSSMVDGGVRTMYGHHCGPDVRIDINGFNFLPNAGIRFAYLHYTSATVESLIPRRHDAAKCTIIAQTPNPTSHITCMLSAGYGGNLHIQIINPIGNGVVWMTPFPSVLRYSYPPPSIEPSSIQRLTAGPTRYTNLPVQFSCGTDVVRFSGYCFGTALNKVRVSFGPPEDPYAYDCAVNVLLSSDNEITCTIPSGTSGIGKLMPFRVAVGDSTAQGSVVSTTSNTRSPSDILGGIFGSFIPFFPQPVVTTTPTFNDLINIRQNTTGNITYSYPSLPVVFAVSGCYNTSISPNMTVDCPTIGGTLITIYGQNFILPLTVTVKGTTCLLKQIADDGTFLTCVLPPGTGSNVAIIVSQNAASIPVNLLSYYKPQIDSISGCRPDNGTLSIVDCSRLGNEAITIYGNYFSHRGARVLIGSQECSKTEHEPSDPQKILYCWTPPGYLRQQAIMVIVLEGDLRVSSLSVSYTRCQPGFHETQSVVCEACRPGEFSELPGQESCLPCDLGKFAAQPASKSCEPCPQGSYAPVVNSSYCLNCTGATFQDRQGQSTCRTCQEGAQYAIVGSDNLFRGCQSCPDGAICLGSGRVLGQEGFWLGVLPTGQLESIRCLPGRCPKCPDLQTNTGNVTNQTVSGFANVREITPLTFTNTTLRGTAASVSTCCGPNRIASLDNPLCGRCKPEFYEWGGDCIPCDRSNILVIVFIIVGAWFYLILFHIVSQSTCGQTKVFMYFTSTCLLMFGGETAWFAWSSVLSFDLFNTGTSVCIAPLTPSQKLLVSLLVPFIFLAELGITFVVRWLWWYYNYARNPINDVKFHGAPYVRTLVGFFIFSFNTTTTTVARYFACTHVASFFDDYVSSSPAVSCHSDGYIALRPVYITFVIVFIIVLPVFGLVHMIRLHRARTLYNPKYIARFGILYETYSHRRYWWESVILSRRAILVMITVVFVNTPTTMYTIMAAVQLLILLTHSLGQPFTDDSFSGRSINQMETLSLTVLVLVNILLIPMSFPLQLWQALLLGIILVLFLAYIIISTVHEVARYRVFPQIADRYPIIRKYGWDQPPKREAYEHDGAGAKRNRRYSEEHLQQHIHQMGGNVEVIELPRGTEIQMTKLKHKEFLEGTHATNVANLRTPQQLHPALGSTQPLPAEAISSLAVGAEIPSWAQAENREVLEETVTKQEKKMKKKHVEWRTSTDSSEERKEGDEHEEEEEDDDEEEDSQQSGSGDGSDEEDDGEEGEESGSGEEDEESDEEGTSDDGSVETRSAASSNATDVTDVSVDIDRKSNTTVKPALRITATTPSPGMSPRMSPSPGAPIPKFANKPKPKKSTLSARLCGGLLAPSRAVAAQSAGPNAPMPKPRSHVAFSSSPHTSSTSSSPRHNYVQPSTGPKH